MDNQDRRARLRSVGDPSVAVEGAQSHRLRAPNAWVTLGAVAQATSTIGPKTCVTAPTFRYHPAVVAQQAATLQIIAGKRSTLGPGSGESLNEHILGTDWPGANTRQARLVEPVAIISALFDGGYVNYRGEHGNDVDAVVTAARKFFDAGYTDLALVQIGADRQADLFDAADKLLPALRSLTNENVGALA